MLVSTIRIFNLLKGFLFSMIGLYYFYALGNVETIKNTSMLPDNLKFLISVICIFGIIFSAFGLLNIAIRMSALFLFLLDVTLLNLNTRLIQIQHTFINIILICIFLFCGQKLFDYSDYFKRHEFKEKYWKKYVHYLFSVALFTSGFSKLKLNLWTEGTALWYTCEKNMLIENYCSWPPLFFQVVTYLAITIELSSILVFVEKFRKYIYYFQILLFLGVLSNVLHVGLFVLVCFLFLLEDQWLLGINDA